jgi:hypothetical protein
MKSVAHGNPRQFENLKGRCGAPPGLGCDPGAIIWRSPFYRHGIEDFCGLKTAARANWKQLRAEAPKNSAAAYNWNRHLSLAVSLQRYRSSS